jgi:hypothetical protein
VPPWPPSNRWSSGRIYGCSERLRSTWARTENSLRFWLAASPRGRRGNLYRSATRRRRRGTGRAAAVSINETAKPKVSSEHCQ